MADGKKGRKVGNKIRKPSAKYRKIQRPELYRKARNVIRCSGEAALTAWVERCYARGESAITVHDAARKAKEWAKARVSA